MRHPDCNCNRQLIPERKKLHVFMNATMVMQRTHRSNTLFLRTLEFVDNLLVIAASLALLDVQRASKERLGHQSTSTCVIQLMACTSQAGRTVCNSLCNAILWMYVLKTHDTHLANYGKLLRQTTPPTPCQRRKKNWCHHGRDLQNVLSYYARCLNVHSADSQFRHAADSARCG